MMYRIGTLDVNIKDVSKPALPHTRMFRLGESLVRLVLGEWL
ncbi:MAG: hypothetical protein QXQ91_00805 [Nanopusillaceae archaeon]